MTLDKDRTRVWASFRDRSEELRQFCVAQGRTLARKAVARHLIGGTDYGLATWKRRVRLLVDKTSARLLGGAEIDYVTSVTATGFAIRNPNAISTCGLRTLL